MSDRKIPAISVIIPMYNAEKYIGECLDSLRAQTFKDFEVIVVDDCSTDNSCEVVEKYVPKFQMERGTLRLIRSKINSGGAATPRNIGLRLSYGEYIYFMDSDDVILSEALEILYKTAEKFKADVVHSNSCCYAPGETVSTDKNILTEKLRSHDNITTPTEFSNDLSVRLKKFIEGSFPWEPWNHLIRRDLIIMNDLEFSNLRVADDMFFTIQILCLAEKILLIPNAFYVWRQRIDSNCHEDLPVEKKIHRRGGDVIRGIGLLDEFTDKFEFFKTHPAYKYALFDFWANHGGTIWDLYTKYQAFQLDPLIRREMTQVKDKTALTAFIFNRMNVFNVKLLQQQNIILQQQNQIQQLQAKLQQSQNSSLFNNKDIFAL